MTDELDPIQRIKSGGWSKTGKLITGANAGEVSAQASLPRLAASFTIQFGITDAPTGSQWNRFAEAEIQWVVEGNFVTRRISVVNGASITGLGQVVKVKVTDKSLSPPAGPVPPEEYTVNYTITPGNRGTTAQPPLLFPVVAAPDLILTSGNAVISVPSNAGITSLNVGVFSTTNTPIPDQAVEVRQLLGGAGTEILRRDDPRAMTWIPLASGSQSIELLNSTADPIQFSLVFGVDG